MTFDIHLFDRFDHEAEDSETRFNEYKDALLASFFESSEGQALQEQHPGAGFWADQLMYYGYAYQGATPPKLSVSDVDEIVTELFPRKISLSTPDEANDAIPELVAFWQFLKREYRVRQADAILHLLNRLAPDFIRRMNDPSNFGMAKSFFMMGQQAGFDMTTREGLDAFMAVYNARILSEGPLRTEPDAFGPPSAGDLDWPTPPALISSQPRAAEKDKARAKHRRKIAAASRRKNRKR